MRPTFYSQNDLQAMARCHRIGQKKEVTVYRLISRDTYEMALFNTASMKYGKEGICAHILWRIWVGTVGITAISDK